MISSPINGSKISVSSLKSNGITSIYAFDTTKNLYTIPSYIEIGKGYWVKSNYSTTINIVDTSYDDTISSSYIARILYGAVDNKWNLLGTPIDITKADLKSRGATAVWWYDPSIGNYSTDDNIKAGSGFWIKGVFSIPPPPIPG
jgi:hypothetical protein